LGRYEEAVAEVEPYADDYASYLPLQRTLTLAYYQAGYREKAGQRAALVMRSDPGFKIKSFCQKLPFKDPSIRNRFFEAMRDAGFS
jgi:hypothetical protein